MVFFCFRDIRVRRADHPKDQPWKTHEVTDHQKKKWKHWNLSNFLFYSENFCTAYILTHFLHTLEEFQLLKVYLSREKHQKQAPWNAQGLQNSWKKDAKKINQNFFYSKILKNMFSLCVSLVLSHYSCFSSPCPIFLFLPTLWCSSCLSNSIPMQSSHPWLVS